MNHRSLFSLFPALVSLFFIFGCASPAKNPLPPTQWTETVMPLCITKESALIERTVHSRRDKEEITNAVMLIKYNGTEVIQEYTFTQGEKFLGGKTYFKSLLWAEYFLPRQTEAVEQKYFEVLGITRSELAQCEK